MGLRRARPPLKPPHLSGGQHNGRRFSRPRSGRSERRRCRLKPQVRPPRRPIDRFLLQATFPVSHCPLFEVPA